MSDKQPEALRLADEIEDACLISGISRREHLDSRIDAATTLRRQHALIESQSALIAELVEALEIAQESWGKTAFPSEIINMTLAKAKRQ